MAADWARPIVHWEIVARDPAIQADFYGQLFHWDITDGAFRQVPAGIGGPEPGPAGHIREGVEAGVVLYVQVGDLSATLVRARELGGQVTSDPFDLPDGPTVAFITDPEGNAVGLVQQ
ncbi:MAG TPA: VOC family protein [Acidimicrobiales bacterium]